MSIKSFFAKNLLKILFLLVILCYNSSKFFKKGQAMAFKHKVTQELDKRGIKTKFFCELHNIKVTSFYQTISGVRPDRKCIKTLYKKSMLISKMF